MMVFLDSSHASWELAHKELPFPIGQLLTPLTGYLPKDPNGPFAIDNGAYAGFNTRKFISLLERENPRMSLCKFVAVPDVVGSARRTREVFEHWCSRLEPWPLAYVCQDGQGDIDIPWSRIAAIFIGGGDEFKDGPEAIACIKAAQAIGKWTHVGRVNGPERFNHFDKLMVDSVDGTGLSQYSGMRLRIAALNRQPELDFHTTQK